MSRSGRVVGASALASLFATQRSQVRTFTPALLTGFSFRHGESVWAPTTTKPAPGLTAPPTAKATTVDALRVKK